MTSVEAVFRELGLEVFQRGWLSSNNIVFRARAGAPATIVDTGYVAHAELTCTLVSASLQGEALERVVNSHLHSDHCGGNALLAQRFGCEVLVPAPSFDVVQAWDEDRLTFGATGQRCDPFTSQGAIEVGQELLLGGGRWKAVAAPGHDSDALMFFEPDARVLISADALWEERLAIIFPELDGEPGFADARSALDVIEGLRPSIVIPGHGRPFVDAASAIRQSRARIEAFERQPGRHALYGARALAMFHMLEHRRRPLAELLAWLCATPVFERLHERLPASSGTLQEFSVELVGDLIKSGLLQNSADGQVALAE